MKRQRLGRTAGAASRQHVYRIVDGLEIDDIDHYEVSRRRVFFDEVIAITYHTQLGWVVALLLGLPALFCLTMAAIFVFSDEMTTAGIFAVLGVVLAIPAVVKLFVRAHVVTVFGKRTKAVMKFAFRHERARRIYEELVAAVRERQEAIRREVDAEAPAPLEGFPLPEEPA